MTYPRGTGCCPLTSEQMPCLGGCGKAHSSCFSSLSPPQQLQPRGTAQSWWLTGARVKLTLNFRLNFSFSGGLKVNFCRSEVKKINNSVLANCSPRHIRFPIEKGRKDSLFLNCPFSKKCSGLKVSGVAHSAGSLCSAVRLVATRVPLDFGVKGHVEQPPAQGG